MLRCSICGLPATELVSAVDRTLGSKDSRCTPEIYMDELQDEPPVQRTIRFGEQGSVLEISPKTYKTVLRDNHLFLGLNPSDEDWNQYYPAAFLLLLPLEELRLTIGHYLYYRIIQEYPERSGKLTGMLLIARG